ncbi:MAG TPA: XrtA system polysaccharide deacetylase [Planctomycetota bacterium]|nr:XrtA system polysaccharide deacetylase [Planctomycetota bacterium]
MTGAHALSVDVEDWFQVLNMAHVIDRAAWDGFELRCGDATKRLLELFDRRGAKATFFFLGWIAERLPDLVREVHAAGHEIGSHGYDHRLLPDLGREGFAQDLARTAAVLEALTGRRPESFRACTWSISRRTPWAVDELLRAGIRLDSSIQPVRHPDYGIPGAPTTPYRLRAESGELLEFPPLTWDVAGRHVPVGGGGYLRLFPLALVRAGLRQKQRAGVPGCLYLHPWEVDPGQPRQALGGLRGFRHYVNLEHTHRKLDTLLQRYRFAGLSAALAQRGEGWLATLPVRRVGDLLGP